MTTPDTPNHADRDHADISPSGVKMVRYCPGFRNRGGTSAAAEKGTRIHEAIEARDPSELLDEDEHEIYEACIRDMDQVIGDLRDMTGIEPVVHQEIRLQIDLGACKTFGTADVLAIAGEWAVLHDHKTGVSRIDPPPMNDQGTSYAIGVFQKFPEIRHIRASFSVPKRNELLVGDYHRDLLPEYVEDIGSVIVVAAYVRRMWDGGTPPLEILTPNDNCRYCEFSETNRCPALGALVFDVVKRYDAGGALPPEGSIHGSDIDDPETLSRMLPLADIAEKWANGVKYRAKEVAMRDGKFPGYVIKSMGSPREISDPVALKEFAEGCGFEIDELLKAATFSLSGLTKIVSAKAPRGQKQDAVRQFEEGLEMFGALTRKPERFSLKPVNGDLDDED
jgi:hypothetical protein